MYLHTCALPGARTRLAGPGRRLVAVGLDLVLFTPAFALMHFLVTRALERGWLHAPKSHTSALLAYAALQLLVPMVVTVFFWSTRGATPGQRALGLRVVDQHTCRHLPWDMAVLRFLTCIVSAAPLGLGFICAAFETQKQAWHDQMALTLVIYTPREDRG